MQRTRIGRAAAGSVLSLSLLLGSSCRRESGDVFLISEEHIQPPTADAGPDLATGYGSVVFLDGTRSKSGNPGQPGLQFRWEQLSGPKATLKSSDTARPSFVAPLADATFSFRLVVTEEELAGSPDEVTITVRNARPTANAGSDQIADPGLRVTLDGRASIDPDAGPGPLRYRWLQTGGAGSPPLSDDTAARPTFTPVFGRDQLTFELTVTDGVLLSPPDTVTIDVDTRPLGEAGPNQVVPRGATVTLDATGSDDPDGDALTYEWVPPENVTLTPNTSDPIVQFDTDPNQDLDYVFELRVFDDLREGISSFVTIQARASASSTPRADAGRTQIASPGSEVSLSAFDSFDPDTPFSGLSFAWSTSDEDIELSSASSATPLFTAPDDVPRILRFDLTVSDGTRSSTDAVQVFVAPSDNDAPIGAAGDDQTVAPGALVTLAGTVDDIDGPLPPTFAWRQMAGAAVVLDDPTSLTPSFTAPSDLAFRALRFRVLSWDGLQYGAADDVMITVSSPDAPIAIAEACDPGDGSAYRPLETVCLDASRSFDPNGFPILEYRWTEPVGFEGILDDPTAELPNVTLPNVHRDLVFTLEVSNGAQFSDPDTVALTIENRPPQAVIQGEPVAAVQPGESVVIDSLPSSDPDGSTLSSSWQQISGNEALQFNSDSLPNLLFTPTQAALIGFTLRPPIVIRLTVDDGNLDAMQSTDVVDSLSIEVLPSLENDVADFLRTGSNGACDTGVCVACHSPTGRQEGAFRVSCDDIDDLFRELTIELSPAEQIPRVDPADPENSLLLRKLRATDGNHDGLYPDSSEQYQLILEWIRAGAVKS